MARLWPVLSLSALSASLFRRWPCRVGAPAAFLLQLLFPPGGGLRNQTGAGPTHNLHHPQPRLSISFWPTSGKSNHPEQQLPSPLQILVARPSPPLRFSFISRKQLEVDFPCRSPLVSVLPVATGKLMYSARCVPHFVENHRPSPAITLSQRIPHSDPPSFAAEAPGISDISKRSPCHCLRVGLLSEL